MNRIASSLVALGLLVLAGGSPFAHAQQAAGVATSLPPTTVVVHGDKTKRPRTWFRAESQHFIVYSNTRHSNVASLLSKMERFWYMLRECSRVDLDPPADTPKQVLYYLDDEHTLAKIDPEAPDYAIGLYTASTDGAMGFGVHMYYGEDPRVPLEKRPENEGLSYIFQAYARDFYYRHSPQRTPLWFIDGYAQYFSTMRFDGDQAVVGMAPEALGKLLQRLGAGYLYSLDYADVLVGNDSAGHSAAGQAGIRNEFEARSWVLTHWILSKPENVARFQAYIAATRGSEGRAGEDRVKAFKRIFDLTPGQLNHTLWLYLRKLEALKVTFKSLPEADITFTDLPESADQLLLAQAALKSDPGAKYGHTLLGQVRTAAARFPDSELAQLTLARAEILYGDPNAVLPWLQKTTQATPKDAEAQYLLGRADLATGAYAAAGVAFAHAAESEPKSPEIAYGFYRAQALGPTALDEDGAGAAVLAYQEAPQVDAYAYHAGLVYAHLGRHEEAAAALHVVADNPRPSVWGPLAKTWLARLGGPTPDADLRAAMGAPDPEAPKGGFDGQADWTFAASDVLQALDTAVANQAAADAGLSTPDTPTGIDSQPGQ
jgi:tetratricopeptide (TPR) repeat protein